MPAVRRYLKVWSAPMFGRIKQLFRQSEPPAYPYIHPSLGAFAFERGTGWKRVCPIEGRRVEVVIGSDGELPSQQMADTARDWVENWEVLRPFVVDYIEREVSSWQPNWHPPSTARLLLSSINVLWTDLPTTAMLYFDDPEDNIRCWHATYRGREPQGLAFDD